MDLAIITNALSLVDRLKEIDRSVAAAEFRSLLADLTVDLARAKEEIATLILENTELKSQMGKLKETDPKISEITEAKWGSPDAELDVLKYVRYRLNNGRLHFLVNNYAFGGPENDPHKRHRKTLRIRYKTEDDQVHEYRIDEGMALSL